MKLQPEDPNDDLAYLPVPTSDLSVAEALHARHSHGDGFTRIGQRMLVAMAPSKLASAPTTTATATDDVNMKAFAAAVKEGLDREPHIFELAASAYQTMVRTKQDQSMVFLGESGAGKSTAYQLALRQLVNVSRADKKGKEDKLAARIVQSTIILDAFGESKTLQNAHASRYGKLMELQFNQRRRLVGASLSDYLLEKTRVTHAPANERSFHTFYYMLAGATIEERKQWNLLGDASKYAYLSPPRAPLADAEHNEAVAFAELRAALTTLGFKEKYHKEVFHLLSAILLIGNLELVEGEAKDEAAVVKNVDLLAVVAGFLGLKPIDLENAFVFKTKLIKNELCTMFLDREEALVQRDALARTLYGLLWTWLVDCLNKRLCHEQEPASIISLVDMFGLENLKTNQLHQLLYNYTAEKMFAFTNEQLFDLRVQEYHAEGVSVTDVTYGDNTKILDLLVAKKTGILSIIDEETNKSKRKTKTAAMVDRIATAHEGNLFFAQPHKKGDGNLFGVRHHGDEVQYDASDFLELNAENQICADFIALFRGGAETTGSSNPFIANLFSEKVIDVKRAKKTVVVAQQDNGPRRKPSIRRKKGQSERAASGKATFGSQYREALDDLLDSLGETNVHFVFCVRPDVEGGSVAFDEAKVAAQLKSMGIADILRITSKGYGDGVALDTFVERYRVLAPDTVDRATSARTKVEAIAAALGWDADEITFGTKLAFLSETAVRALNLSHARAVREEKKRLKEKIAQSRLDGAASGEDYSDVGSDVGSIGHSDIGDGSSTAGTDFTYGSDAESETGAGIPEKVMASVVADGAMPPIKKKVEPANEEEVEEISTVRKYWLRLTTFLTWWIPACCLRRSGMVRADIQQAWREKVAICILIFLLSGTMVFFIAGFSLIMCPRDNMYDLGELAGYVTPQEQWIAVHGNIYNYANQEHRSAPEEIREWAGRDASELFPLYADECGIKEDVPSSDRVANTTGFPHPPGTWKTKLTKKNKKIWKGYLAFRRDEIKEHNKAKDFWIIVENDVFDMTWYRVFDQGWLGSEATGIIFASGGMDATDAFQNMQTREGKAALKCMKNVFFKGKVDSRDNPACIFANTLLLTATGILVTILVIKFLCAFQLGSSGDPENHDRFVMLQVPCYTEGEDSLRRTIESLTSLRYDDKRKLLFLIADGNIIGSGNDRPTWRIVLDILGVDPSIDPPKLSYLALGEGNKQQNMAKVYTGLYDFQGHLVPYIVVVKVGKDSETRRPGNRGKRDSQMILMRFMQKVHYDDPMSPLELEMFHQIKNVIGVDPTFYEFVLMVDADTEVMSDSLNRMVSTMVHDARVVGLCGETMLANEQESAITMMQVYEYYISHHLSKSFESLFGSVTCLPGCFCMYRIRTPNKSIPLLTSKPVIQDYAVNNVDTLHKKNLLSLGEDRYLTTLMLKHFPNMKMKFTPDAQCKTYAPERYSVLLSQRRRWINSTIHNLMELMLLPQLCGFCCFSMRFVVFFDLFATLVMPASMGYFVYLIYTVVASSISGINRNFPLITVILLGAAYGLQVIIFLFKRQWQHIGWLVIYLLAMPLFVFWLPLYSFWHMDDFSWGNTRVVVGERGGKKLIVDEEPFDPESIPMKKWSEYEQEMWEKESQATGLSRPSQVASGYGMPMGSAVVYPPPGYQPSFADVKAQQRASIMQATQRAHSYVAPVGGAGSDEPSDEQVTSQIKTILATANLMTVTKKQVRDELSAFFGTDMTPRKDFINKIIEDVLQGRI